MKNLINAVGRVAILSLIIGVFGLVGPSAALAATTPTLGAAASYAVLGGTYSNTSAATTVNGDVGFSTGPATAPLGAHPNYGPGAPYTQAHGTDAAAALSNLNLQLPCTFNFAPGAVDISTAGPNGATGVYTAGIYCSTGAMNIGVGGITLNGPGTFIFRAVGALTSTTGSTVTLGAGVSACDVFWTPTSATSLANLTHFEGTIIDNANAITIGANSTVTGRMLSLGAGTVTTGDTDTLTAPTCAVPPPPASSSSPGVNNDGTINVVKTVINDNGGTAVVSDFPLFVNGTPVISGETNTFSNPAGVYTVTETSNAKYTQSFSGDCDVNGNVALNPGDAKFCIITNNDIGAPVVPPVPPLIDVVKVPSPLALPAGPGNVQYTYTLRNIGTVPVTNITMVGDTCSPIQLVSGDTNNDAKLQVNETWVYTCSTTLAATHTNTVVATGWANGISATSIASATVVVGTPVVPPIIHVTKIPSPLALRAGGGTVNYTEKITNPGTVALSNVTLNDDKCSPMKYISGDTNGDSKLDPTETWTYTCAAQLTQTTTNTATATGMANGMTARDLAIATVVVAAVVPALPNTGFAPVSNIFSLILVAAGLLAAAVLFYALGKKRSA